MIYGSKMPGRIRVEILIGHFWVMSIYRILCTAALANIRTPIMSLKLVGFHPCFCIVARAQVGTPAWTESWKIAFYETTYLELKQIRIENTVPLFILLFYSFTPPPTMSQLFSPQGKSQRFGVKHFTNKSSFGKLPLRSESQRPPNDSCQETMDITPYLGHADRPAIGRAYKCTFIYIYI